MEIGKNEWGGLACAKTCFQTFPGSQSKFACGDETFDESHSLHTITWEVWLEDPEFKLREPELSPELGSWLEDCYRRCVS